jgi:endonuclease/exonuclease/phosphatase (EEP) superfamily protein YafD
VKEQNMIQENLDRTDVGYVNEIFTLLCWNIHKEMGQPAFDERFSHLIVQTKPDFILLQEAVLDRHTEEYLEGFNFAAAVNIGLRHKQFGVLTAARAPISRAVGLKTNRKEMRFATRKSLLITTHPLQDGTELTTVNIHAINFVSANIFIEEIERLVETLLGINGPMIVTGDFNTWSKKRLEYLNNFAKMIGLEAAVFENHHHIKRRFAKPLDHLFYRGLNLQKAEAVDTGRISDHNPILATFALQQT